MTDDSLGQNYSEVSFEFDKYNKPKQLNLRETVANTIVNEREKGRFISVEDLQSRGKVSQTLIEKLRTMGVLEQMPESSQLSLF